MIRDCTLCNRLCRACVDQVQTNQASKDSAWNPCTENALALRLTMNKQTPARPSLQELLLRILRIAASTVAIVELLRNNWLGGALATMAWLLFIQVERLQNSSDQDAENGTG